ncbi:MAG: methyltransferase domain-containing protein [Candidatus Aenigmarchaeota archaeon]|nr:methyltransferase domain-containing protein [Candidatus Aenigmarchaeota archaeon]
MKFKLDDYAKAFETFTKSTTQHRDAINYITNNILSKTDVKKLKNNGWRVLDIGAGVGDEIIPIIKFLNSYGNTKLFALGPSKKELDTFEGRIEEAGIDAKIIRSNWEKYEPKVKFDFIIASHVFYHIKNWETMIPKVIDSLNDNGVAIITLHTQNNIVYRLPTKLRHKMSTNLEKKHEHSAKELCKLLDNIKNNFNITYDIETVKNKIDITNCKKMNQGGKNLTEFFLLYPYSKIDDNLKKQIIDYFNSLPDVITKEVAHIWIFKK